MSEPTDRPTAQAAPPPEAAGSAPPRPATPSGLRPAAAEASPSAALAAAQASARERLERMRAQIAAASVLSRPADGAPRPAPPSSSPSAPARPVDPAARPAAVSAPSAASYAAPTPAQQPQAALREPPAEAGSRPAASAPPHAEPDYAADDAYPAEDYDGATADPEPIEPAPAAPARPAKKTKLRGKVAKAPKEASRAATKLASLPGGVAPGREKAPPVEPKEPKIEWRSLLSTALQWPWPSILTIYLRLNAALWFAMGLYYWARITGFVPWRMHYFWDMPVTWQSAIVLYAVLNLVTAVGLWLTAPWGPIVWVFTIVCQIVTHSALSDVFGERPFRIPFYVLSVFIYVILSILARRSRR